MLPQRNLGPARAWKVGEQWRWCPVGKWAPKDAEHGDRYRGPDGQDVIHVNRGGEQWRYATRESDAPKDALPAHLVELDGELALCVQFGDSGVNVRGAAKAVVDIASGCGRL